jgi:DNA-binding beta-propeller fold protein YncE
MLLTAGLLVAGLTIPLAAAALARSPDRAGRPAAAGHRAGKVGTVLVTSLHELTLIRVATDQVERTIALPGWPWAMAVTPDRKLAFVASFTRGRYGLVTPVRLTSGTAGRPIRVPPQPVDVAISPDGRTVYVASQIDGDNQYPGRITPIHVATGRAGTPIRVGIDPGPVIFSKDGATAYVLNYGFGSQGRVYLTPITVATGRAGTPIALPSASGSLAMAPDGRTIYATATQETGPPPPSAQPGGPGTRAAGQRRPGTALPGRLIPIDTMTNRAGAPIKLPGSPDAIMIAPDGRYAYVLDDFGSGHDPERVLAVSVPAGRVGRPVPVGASAYLLALAPRGRTVYALGNRSVVPVRVPAGRAEPPIAANAPVAMAFTPDGRTGFVLLTTPAFAHGNQRARSEVVPFTTATGATGRPIKVGQFALAIAVLP